MYADDTTLYCNLSNNTNKNYPNSELHKISEWLASNKLSLNAQKTKFMVFHCMQKKVKYPVLTLNNTTIERIKQSNVLGIILHYTLKWPKHSLKNTDYVAHSEPICKDLRLLKMPDMFRLALWKFCYKLMNNKLPPILKTCNECYQEYVIIMI